MGLRQRGLGDEHARVGHDDGHLPRRLPPQRPGRPQGHRKNRSGPRREQLRPHVRAAQGAQGRQRDQEAHLQPRQRHFGYAGGDHADADRHRGRPPPDGGPARPRAPRLLALPRHHGRRQVRLEDPDRHGRARPLPRVDPAVDRSQKAGLRRVRAPQRGDADVVIQVLPTDLIPDEKEGKVLKVKFIQKEGKDNFDPAYLFDEGSTIEWTPCGKKLTCSYPGIKFAYGPDEFLGNDVTVLEMDGKFDNLQELIYAESHLSNTATKFYGELTQQMIKMGDSPGSDNGTGFFQTLASLKIREFYEKLSGVEVEVEAPAKVAA